jgi:hypothetical protein
MYARTGSCIAGGTFGSSQRATAASGSVRTTKAATAVVHESPRATKAAA